MLKKIYQEEKNSYFEEASKEIGIWINDYERHPDTGAILADNSYLSNEDEVEERSEEMFAENIIKDYQLEQIFDIQDILKLIKE